MRGAPFFVLLAAACYDPSYTDATRCGAGDECPTGRECRGGFCLPPGGPRDGGGGAGDAAGGTVDVLVRKNVTAGGTVSIGAMSCGPSCAQLAAPYSRDGTITLRIDAFPAPGWTFQSWTGDCSGPSRACDLRLDADHQVQAQFVEIDVNLIFISSLTHPGNFAAAGGIDRVCEQRAEAAGLTGTFRTLAVSDSGGLLGRLINTVDDATTARGFVRMDGEVVADTAEDLVVDHHLRHAILYDELGRKRDGMVWTGALANGDTASATCNLWRGGVTGAVGVANGAATLTNASSLACDAEAAVICAMVDRRVTIPPLATPPVGSKQIFVGSVGLLGNTVATAGDAVCAQDRTGARALVATTTSSAAALLQAGTRYYRPDGVFVGTGADLVAGRPRTGIWLEATGTPSLLRFVWTGAPAIGELATAATNCDDWTAVTPNGIVGTTTGDDSWWRAPGSRLCGGAYITYCVDP